MGLQSLINNYYFYTKYIWLAADFAAFQSNLLAQVALLGGGNAQIISGLLVTPGGGLNVNVAPGVCMNSSGYAMYIPTQQTVAVASPVGNPAISLVVARPLLVDNTLITNPTNPLVNVPLLQQQSFQIVVLNGTPGATPVAPTPGANDVVLGELSLTASIATITGTNFLYDLVNRAIKQSRRITPINYSNSPYICTGREDVVECDCTSGAVQVTMVAASGVPGQTTTFIKIDNSANSMVISSASLISGQSSQSFDDQWSIGNIYSSGLSYRML